MKGIGSEKENRGPKYRKNEASAFYAQFRLFSASFPPGKVETSDFFGQKYGGFASKVRRFYAKKSDVSVLPKDEIQRTHSPPHKNIFLLKSPTFPTPGMENPNKTWQSRVKDWV